MSAPLYNNKIVKIIHRITIVQGNEKTDYNYVKNVAGELITVITYYCGGTGKIL